MMLFITALLVANVASLGYVFRAKIREALTRTVYICTLDDDDLASTRPGHATPSANYATQDTNFARLAVYREILAATGLDALRCEAGALMLACQSLHMRGVLLTTGLRPFVASLKKSDDMTIRNYITRNGG